MQSSYPSLFLVLVRLQSDPECLPVDQSLPRALRRLHPLDPVAVHRHVKTDHRLAQRQSHLPSLRVRLRVDWNHRLLPQKIRHYRCLLLHLVRPARESVAVFPVQRCRLSLLVSMVQHHVTAVYSVRLLAQCVHRHCRRVHLGRQGVQFLVQCQRRRLSLQTMTRPALELATLRRRLSSREKCPRCE